MTKQETEKLVQLLQARFEKNSPRHPDVDWSKVEKKLRASRKALAALQAMEETGGEPDVVSFASAGRGYIFCDCAPESPAGRRSLCYDRAAWESRKENKPKGSVVELATTMGISLLTEEQYRELQSVGTFDLKTSSWIQTPDDVRSLGGALFCDRRFGRVFVYHNGAESYYAARGFRGLIEI